MTILPLLNPLFWLSMEPLNVDGLAGKLVFGFFLFLVLFGVVSRMLAQHKTKDRYMKHIGFRLGHMSMTMGLVGLVLCFFSYELIRFFGARFWYPVWAVVFMVWLVKTILYMKKEVPSMRLRDDIRKNLMKYMPHRKK